MPLFKSGFTSDEISAMVTGGLSVMQGHQSYAHNITPQNFGAPMQPVHQTSPFSSMAGLYGAYQGLTQEMPGSIGQQRAMEQMQMQALGAVVSPTTPIVGPALFSGMQQQFALNRMMEQQFQHVRPGGMGFTGAQQMQVGAGLQQMAAQTPFVEMGDLTRMMQQGAQMGQFAGIRDVQPLLRRTREMLSQWQTIATELNTTLSEAGRVAGSLRQMGIFRGPQQVAAVQQMAGVAAVTGIPVTAQMQAGAVGAQMAPAMFGQGIGVRAAGAQAMRRQLEMIGQATAAGVVSEGQIFEATGMMGMEGRAAMAQRMNQLSARFMRRGTGKYTMAAFVDPNTMELDEDLLQRFMAGGIGRGEIQRRAGQNAARMGYVRWQANKSRLAAQFTAETGGLGQMALMRTFLGADVMADPERAQLALGRLTGAAPAEAEIMMSQLQALPMLQNRAMNEERMFRRQQEMAQRWQQYGPQAQFERQKQKLRQAVVGPLEDLSRSVQTAFWEGVEGVFKDAAGINQRFVSESTREMYARAGPLGGGRQQFRQALTPISQQELAQFRGGSARGLGDLALFGGTAGGAAARAAGRRGGGTILAGMAAGYATDVGILREVGVGLAGREGLGGLIGRGLESVLGGIPEMARSAELANAYNTGNISGKVLQDLGLDSAKFRQAVDDDRVAQAVISNQGGMAGKIERVKSVAGLTGANADEQAKAIIASVSKTKNLSIKFGSPIERSREQATNAADAMKAYIGGVLQQNVTAEGRAVMEAGASQWLADTDIQRMLREGSPISDIQALAQKRYGVEAGQFVTMGLEPSEERVRQIAEQKGVTEDVARRGLQIHMRRRMETISRVAQYGEAAELMRRTYGGQREQFEEAQLTGRLKKTGTGRAGRMFRRYTQIIGGYDPEKDEDMLQLYDQMDKFNMEALKMEPGDMSRMITMMRDKGMTQVANQMQWTYEEKQRLGRGPGRRRRTTALGMALGLQGVGGAFEDILGGRGGEERKFRDVQRRIEEMSEEDLAALGYGGTAKELLGEVSRIGAMGKEDLDAFIALQKQRNFEAEKDATESKEREEGERKAEQLAAYRNTKTIAEDVKAIRMARGLGTGTKVIVIGEGGEERTGFDENNVYIPTVPKA